MWQDYGIYLMLFILLIAATLIHKAGAWGSIFYTLGKRWRHVGFAVFCALCGVIFAFSKDGMSNELTNIYYQIQQPAEKDIASTIRTCKRFVTAKINGHEIEETQTRAAGFIKISGPDYWNVCAHTFGMNYWKHDISIDGQNGGTLLCNAYADNEYRSGKVQAWCDTVFAQKPKDTTGQKI